MPTKEPTRVIEFPQITQRIVPEQTGQFTGQVHRITSLRGLKIYWDRDTRPYSSAGDFFGYSFRQDM